MVLEKLPTKTTNAIDEAGQKIIIASTGGIVNTASDLLEGLLGCRIREWKNQNILRMTKKTYDLAQEMGVDLSKSNPLPKSEIYQLFENVSKTDDEMTSDLWAGLLANALNSNSNEVSRIGLITTIQQLEPLDVKVIDLLYFYGKETRRIDSEKTQDNILEKSIGDKLQELQLLDNQSINHSIRNLARLNIIEDCNNYQRLISVNDILSISALNHMGNLQVNDDKLARTLNDLIKKNKIFIDKIVKKINDLIKKNNISNDKIFSKSLFLKGMGGHTFYNCMNYKFTNFGDRLINDCYID